MAIFNFFGETEHRTYNHKPIYYDAEKEKRRQYFGAVDGSAKKEGYVPGSYVRGAFRDGAYKRTKSPMKTVQTIIGIITMLLVVAVIFFFLKLYPYLFVK
ncbi:MAG: hypothetical protein II891_03015 [Bacteroidales bacterium]|nr:hypothetical protein [Bacteroidales bacterium]